MRKKYDKLIEKQERKRLIDLKKEIIRKPKRPKMLSLDEVDIDTSNLEDDKESDYPDIRDIDFKLMHNLNELQNKSLSCKKFTLREVNLLKIVLTCGLYPQIAISDEFNNYKRDSDQCFHSKHKAFVVLHPTSIFAYDPDILQPCDDGIIKEKLKFSTRHQLLVYVNLFETNKAYFMNCMRVSALQNLLLYSKSLDTNLDCARIICDDWLEIRFLDADSAQRILSAVLYLRSSIDKLFKIRLEDRQNIFKAMDEVSYEEKHDISVNISSNKERAKTLERLLKKKLSEFTDSSVLYSLRRVMPAEIATIYVKNFANAEGEDKKLINDQINPDLGKYFENKKDAKINETKGGYRITDYLTYNW